MSDRPKNSLLLLSLLVAFVLGLSLPISPSRLAASGAAQEVRYGVGNWDPESGLGNHRVVVRVESPAVPSVPSTNSGTARRTSKKATVARTAAKPTVVRVVIPWRRRDAEPEKKDIIVIDAATGRPVANVLPLAVEREFGDILFEPMTVPGDYYFYFMPYASEGRKNYPNVKYDPPAVTADPAWIKAAGLAPDKLASLPADAFPRARVLEIQSADEFSAFTPMERIATAAETKALLARHPEAAYLVFPEDRRLSIRMTGDLPYHWAVDGPAGAVRGEAARGEYFTFQIGLWAARATIEDVEVKFTDLNVATEAEDFHLHPGVSFRIPRGEMTCFNKGGINWDGTAFIKAAPVEMGKVQALWCGVQIPRGASPGVFSGTVTVAPRGLPETALAIEIRVTDALLEDRGDADPYRMTRLRWLDSTFAQDDSIVPPYTPVTVEAQTIGCLGRSLRIGADGLPAEVRSFFAQEMTRLQAKSIALTAGPLKLVAVDAAGRELPWAPGSGGPGPRPAAKGPGAVVWETENRAGDLVMKVAARMEFDGFVDYKVAITARRDTALSDIRLEVPYREENARYMMGLGFKGGLRPEKFEWSWDQKKNQDALWIGTVNAGMQVGLRAENYSRPLNTNFYLSKPLNLPASWWNEGRGKVVVRTEGPGAAGRARAGRAVVVSATSGPRTIRAGETLHFDFTLLITPFKPLDPAAHFGERYYHAFKPLDEVAATGANVINVHHANAINPYINYPFLRPADMKAYIDEAHRRGFKVKIYDTVRELSNRAPELFALRSLGHEIFSPGPGGGYSWLQEHLGSDYIAAWFVPELKDAAIINSGLSRWHNYYIEGLDWLARNVGIDGLYLDDVAFDRTTMKRVRKVLDSNRPGALIDLHSANQYNVRDGFASSANLYLEHFPFLNRLWFGEYFDYNGSGPDYWLVELSGLPFGLMGEMLQDGGNPWRGMVFGMTARLPWAGDPRPLWKVWDEFGIVGSEMIGWWVDGNPVKTGATDVLATCYVRRGRSLAASRKIGVSGNAAMVALASWAKDTVDVRLVIDWKALGLDPNKVRIVAPGIDKFQDAAEFKLGDPIRVNPGKGRLLVLR
jgi:Glycoside hydrolase 123, N-terminal domain